MIEVNHDAHEVSVEQLKGIEGEITGIPPTRESVSARLNAPVTSNHIDMEKISFERNKSGIWGWRSEKSEDVNGYECKVYAASNVEFITRTRTEHLSESQAKVSKNAENNRADLIEPLFFKSFEILELRYKISWEWLKKNVVKRRARPHHPNRNHQRISKILENQSPLRNIFRTWICVAVTLAGREK